MGRCSSHWQWLVLLALVAASIGPYAAQAQDMPPAANPHAGDSYGGCERGFCPADDPEAEQHLYTAAASDDVEQLKQLLASPTLNLSRNIVPDPLGFATVGEVASWAAVKHCQLEAVQLLIDEGVMKRQGEEGQFVDLAVTHGCNKVLELLLSLRFRVGGNALAYAARFRNIDAIQLLLDKGGQELDLKAAMEAACSTHNDTIIRTLIQAGGFAEMRHPVTGRPLAHDWRGQYTETAVKHGNALVLELLFGAGYEVTWNLAQDLIAGAAENGSAAVLQLLLKQPTIADDEDELDESVERALKLAAENGHQSQVDLLLTSYAQESKPHCPAAIIRATRYGHFGVVRRLQSACNVSESNQKLQEAAWQGHIFTAARHGHSAVLELLLSRPDATKLLSKLSEVSRGSKVRASDEDGAAAGAAAGPGSRVKPGRDPLVEAAARGHLAAVRLLAKSRVLCAPCGVVAAAKGGHRKVVEELVNGPAASVLLDDEDQVPDALRATAEAMTDGHWDVAQYMLHNHESLSLGPYFLTAVAQAGKVDDMRTLLGLLSELDMSSAGAYLNEQLHSAMVTAAMGGHLDILQMLTQTSLLRSVAS